MHVLEAWSDERGNCRILALKTQYTELSRSTETVVTTYADDAEESKPSKTSQQIGHKPLSYNKDEELDNPPPDMSDKAPFFIASFSGTDKDRCGT